MEIIFPDVKTGLRPRDIVILETSVAPKSGVRLAQEDWDAFRDDARQFTNFVRWQLGQNLRQHAHALTIRIRDRIADPLNFDIFGLKLEGTYRNLNGPIGIYWKPPRTDVKP
jgi:hypothetical protein